MQPEEIASALPDFKKADKLLSEYLKQHSGPLGKFKPENYFNNTKSRFLNVKTADVRAVSKALCKKKNEKYFRGFADFLWNSGVFEKMSIAGECYAYADLKFSDFEKIVKKIDNWAHNDLISCHVSGEYFLKHNDEIKKLTAFAKSVNPWERRFACVSLITTLRDPNAEHRAALRILDMLMKDPKKKIIGAATDWMIREYTRKNYEQGFEYMKKWAKYCKKNNDKNVRWVLVRARHKLKPKDKELIERMIEL